MTDDLPMTDNEMSANEPPPRLYLSVPPFTLQETEATGALLEGLAQRLDIACVNLELTVTSPELQAPLAELVARLQKISILCPSGSRI